MVVWVLLLLIITVSALVAVAVKGLLASVISLGFMSAALAGAYFHMGLPYAGAFELSAGAGLTTVMFVTILSMVGDKNVVADESAIDWMRFLGIAITIFLVLILGFSLGETVPTFFTHGNFKDLGVLLWSERTPDIVALGLLVFAGALGISAMFSKEGGDTRE